MTRTRRRRRVLNAVATVGLCLKPAAIMAWSTPVSVDTSSTRSSLSNSRDCTGLCGAMSLPQQLSSSTPTPKKRRRHRVSLVGRARAQSSGGLEELEKLRAAAEANGPQQRQQTSDKPTTRGRDSNTRKRSRGAGGKGGDGDGGGGGGGKGGKRKLQSVDFTTALVMSRELAQAVVPARVENAYQLDPYNLAIGLRTLEGNLWLHVSWHPQGARCHVGAPPPREKEQKTYTFSQTLRSLIRGLNIVKVELARPFERVVALDLSARLDEPPSYRIFVEIMASRSNVVLVAIGDGGVETVAACAYQVSPSRSVRPLSTGQPYKLPPAMLARRPSLGESLEDFIEGVGRVPTVQLKKALVGVYQGTSPALVDTIVSCVPGLTPSTKVGDIAPDQWSALYLGPWKRWLELVGDGTTTGAASTPASTHTVPAVEGRYPDDGLDVASQHASGGGDGSSSTKESSMPPATTAWLSRDGLSYYPTTLGGESSGGSGDGRGVVEREMSGSLQGVMERYYRGTQSNEEFDELRRRCLARISATLAKLREREAEFEEQLAAAQDDKVEELNRRGNLLVTYGHAWVQGETYVNCVDFDTGENITVPISAGKTPVEEAQQAFKLGKKLKRSTVVVMELLDQVKAQILYAEGVEMALEQLRGGVTNTNTNNSSSHVSSGTSAVLENRGVAAGAGAASREELAVLRGISEELGLQGGREAARKFAGVFGVKHAQLSDKGGEAGGGGGGKGKSGGKKGKGKRNGNVNKKGGVSSGNKSGNKKESLAGLLELRRGAPRSPAVLVGRNNLQNDQITFSVARAHELWFHARGVAGAHVLLRLEPGQVVEDDDVQFAADVAVYFSKARQSASTPVDYISPKAVKKMGGGGPGMVKYEGEKVVRGEPSRVEAIVTEALRLREEAAT